MSSKGKSAVAGEQDQQGGFVPKLRFPEFRDAPAWELWPLKKLAKRRTRKNVGAKVDRVLTNSAEHGVVDQRDYFEKDIANPGNLEGYFIIEKGDYVYNPRVSNLAPVGPIHKNDVGLGVMSPLYTVFFFDNVQNDFYSQYFKTPHWHQYLRHVSNSGARHDRMAISADDFINMPVPVSNPLEQQRIADCLSSIDVLIAAEAEKLDALKDHKKGLLQQLFPAPGETTPRLRFPEFQDAGDWRAMTIGDVSSVTTGKRDTQNKDSNGTYPFFVRSQTIERINSFSYDGEAILTSGDGVGVGKNFHYIVGKFDFHQRVYCIYKFRKGVSGNFIFHYFSSNFFDHVSKLSAKNSVDSVRMSMITDMPLQLPTLHEQQKIADCLSSIDALVAAQGSRIDALKVHKQGLMQQLFPVADQVQA